MIDAMRVLVVGGTGVVGRHAAAALVQRGYEVAVFSRHTTSMPGVEAMVGDLTTGEGLSHALAGVDCVVDCANVSTTSTEAAIAYFTKTTRLLTEQGAAAGVKHHVVLSIVGVDVVPYGYFQGKLAQERTAQSGPVPVTILRSTQFHEFAGQVLQRLRVGPMSFVPTMLVQPIAAAEVGVALAEVVDAGPAGRAADIAGPRAEHLPDMARRLVRHQHQRRLVVPLRIPGAVGRSMRQGGLLPGSNAVLRGQSFAEWLPASEQ